ncbi:MAG: FtsX-like permease family protein [Ornithinibacter sp.]
MTTLAPAQHRPDGAHHSPSPPTGPGRYAEWLASWTVALRMARRDVRRHKGRSAIIVVMVAVPTLLLSVLVTIAATSDVSGAERIEPTMGSAQALLEGPESQQVFQQSDPWTGTGSDGTPAAPIEGFDRAVDAFGNAGAVSRLAGAPVSAVSSTRARTTIGDRRISFDVMALSNEVDLGAKTALVSGRWPKGIGEAAVTQYGLTRDLPRSGSVTIDLDGAARTVAIVGIVPGRGPGDSDTGLVVSQPLTDTAANGRWFVTGPDPVPWTKVLSLNRYGLTVTSAAVLRDPPSESQLPEQIRGGNIAQSQQTALMVTLGATMLLIITALLVGPAFAVSATRQRRTLALAASNGASTPVLRRTVLAQALVLGGISSVFGVLLGVVVAWGVVAFTARDGLGITGPFDVRWGLLAGIALCAALSTLVAALVPARRLGRLDIVGVMRGQSVSPRPSRLLFVAGLVLAGLGAATVLGSTRVAGLPSVTELLGIQQGSDLVVTIGAVLLILGALFLVPVILTLVGRLGSHLPTSLRMAARDLARHRSRSAPSVAAVLAVVAGLAFGLTGLASDTEQQLRQYVPQSIAGEALLFVNSDAPFDTSVIGAAAPGLVATDNLAVDTGDPWLRGNAQPVEPFRLTFVSIVPAGCSPERTVEDPGWQPANDTEANQGPPCSRAGTNSYNGGSGVVLLPADEVVRRIGLDQSQAAAVRAGAVVARDPGMLSADGKSVRLARGTYVVDPQEEGARNDPSVEVDQDVSVPLVVIPNTKENLGRMLGASLVLATDTTTTRGWPTISQSVTLRDPSGVPVTDAAAERLQNQLGDDAFVQVEKGFERYDRLVVAILLGVFALLILVITLTSTALSLAEQQSDQATLAALGATRGTRRVMAAAQALVLAAVGCLLGVAVGLVPGIAIARLLTSDNDDPLTGMSIEGPSILVIPWLQLAVVGLLVPLVAAGIAGAGIRKAPQVTRRT